jgi:hypothetical protein
VAKFCEFLKKILNLEFFSQKKSKDVLTKYFFFQKNFHKMTQKNSPTKEINA